MNIATERSVSIPGSHKDLSMKLRPRVLHVVDSLEIGGLERLVHDLIIARGGEGTSVACVTSVGPFGQALRKLGIAVTLIGRRGGFLLTTLRMWRHLRRFQPDVVHCHNFVGLVYGALAARLAGAVPAVMTRHGAAAPMGRLGDRLSHYLIHRVSVVAVSRESTDLMEAWMGSGRPVRYVPNGIFMGSYRHLLARETARAQLDLPESCFIVGIIARVTRAKGHQLLLDVFAGLQSKIPKALLVIVGDGAELPAVKSYIRKLALEKSVLIMGERQDVPTILAALDVFCLPSETEGMPMTVLEAMAVGLPVVASDVGGIPELVKEGHTGLMVPPRAADELGAALLALARDPQRAREMGRAGRERLLKEFCLESTLSAYEEIYREAIGRRRGLRIVVEVPRRTS
jgi:glycosyltransferase involved in cell wall biosynthesis